MHAGFEFQPREHPTPLDLGDDLLEAAERRPRSPKALRHASHALRHNAIHAEEVAGEQRRLVAAGAGADFEDGAFLVGRVLRQQRDAQFLFERREPHARLGALALGKAAHLGIELGIFQKRFDTGDFLRLAAIGADRRDDIIEFGQFARQGDEGRRSWPVASRSEISAWRRRIRSSFSRGNMAV